MTTISLEKYAADPFERSLLIIRGVSLIKHFFFVMYKLEGLTLASRYQPSIIYAGKAKSYSLKEHHVCLGAPFFRLDNH